jgi:hypothetical protein
MSWSNATPMTWSNATPSKVRRILNVDFHDMREDGRLLAHQCSFAPLIAGDLVIAQDTSEGMEFTGTVTGGSADGRWIYLTMDWEDESPHSYDWVDDPER